MSNQYAIFMTIAVEKQLLEWQLQLASVLEIMSSINGSNNLRQISVLLEGTELVLN